MDNVGDGGVGEADFLGANVEGGGVVCEGEGVDGAVAAEADVEHVFCAGGEGDDVDDVSPERGVSG